MLLSLAERDLLAILIAETGTRRRTKKETEGERKKERKTDRHVPPGHFPLWTITPPFYIV